MKGIFVFCLVLASVSALAGATRSIRFPSWYGGIRKCPKSCAAVSCPRPDTLGCKFGFGIDRCGCCKVCLKGLGEPCAGPFNLKGNCAPEYVCIDAKLNKIPVKGRGRRTPIGECDKPFASGTCLKICPIFCPPPQTLGCRFGITNNPCSCCKQCLKGPGETCAGPNNVEGSCIKNLVCLGPRGKILPNNGGEYNPVGKCTYPKHVHH